MLAYRAAKRFVQNKQADELAGVFIVDSGAEDARAVHDGSGQAVGGS
jgi:hypothetical protein